MLSRRTCLRQSASALASAALLRDARASEPRQALVGSQLFGWGQYYQREGKNLDEHLDEIFSALRDAGYDYAEHGLSRNAEANGKLGERMKTKGLKPVSFYTGGGFHDEEKAAAEVEGLVAGARGAKEAGFTIVNCNPNAIGRDKTDRELATQTKWLEVFGGELAKLGLKLGIHNHTPEMANGAKEFHANLRQTGAEKVGFCYDVHWVFRGGIAPPDALAAYGSRIVSWHLRQSRGKIWWEDLDSGDVDY